MRRSTSLGLLLLTAHLTACTAPLLQGGRRSDPSAGQLVTAEELAQIEEIERQREAERRRRQLAEEAKRLREQLARAEAEANAQPAEPAAQDTASPLSPATPEPVGHQPERQPDTVPTARPGDPGAETSPPALPHAKPETTIVPSPFRIGDDVLTKPSLPDRLAARKDTTRASRRRLIPTNDPNPTLVTISFLDTPIEDVVAAFSTYSGRSILLGDDVRGKRITGDIWKQPWNIALEMLLAANGLEPDVDTETGIIAIRTMKSAREYEASQRPLPDVYPISYAKAGDLANVLTNVFGERISVTEVSSNNSLLISAPPEVLAEVEELIAKLDVPPPTVTIQAKIVTIARSQLESLGFRYSIEDPNKPYNPSGSGGSGGLTGISGMPQVIVEPSGFQTNAPPLLLNRKSGASLSSFLHAALNGTPFELTAFIDALEGFSLAEVESAPVVTTLSNQTATVDVGDAFHVPTVIAPTISSGTTGGGSSGDVGMVSGARAGTNTIAVGSGLTVTPTVTEDGKVRLEISAKLSSGEMGPDGTVKESYQSGKTVVIVESGETAVLAGLSFVENTTGTTGVPVLQHLPIIGKLFQTKSNAIGRRDMIILVTPTVHNYQPNNQRLTSRSS